MKSGPDDLCRKAQQGDMQAASELLMLFYEKIFAYLRRLCGSESEAQDLTQKTFSKVWASLPHFQARSTVSTWIHGIAHHVYIDWRRKTNRLEPQSEEWWLNCSSPSPGPYETVARNEAAQRLYEAVERLPEETRVPIHLRYYQELALEEIAEILGVSASTVKNRLREALELLRLQTAEPIHKNK